MRNYLVLGIRGFLTCAIIAALISVTTASYAQLGFPPPRFFREVIRHLSVSNSGTLYGYSYDVPQIIRIHAGDNTYYGLYVAVYAWRNDKNYCGALLLCDCLDLNVNPPEKRNYRILDIVEVGANTNIEACWNQHMSDDRDEYDFGSLILTTDLYTGQRLFCIYKGKWRLLLQYESPGERTILPGPGSVMRPPEAMFTIGMLNKWNAFSDSDEQEKNPLVMWMDANNISYPRDAENWPITNDSVIYLQFYQAFGVLYAYKMYSSGAMYGQEDSPLVMDFSHKL
jgi:hypothetical protein